MNRFRRKKDVKEGSDGSARDSTDTEPPTPTIKYSKTFRLGRKNTEPEPPKELNLENALPSADNFRTSLLMNGLSARFSMLREQDDPSSKIGKASDDSVLFPKRASRLNDFAFQGQLSDIAEVSSISGSVRPPFAFSRDCSFADGYGTDDESVHTGSIMTRPKPGEGNVLFGGRQKIYKIPASAAKNGAAATSGRALYDDDVSQSAFQKLRAREREQKRQEEESDEADQSLDASMAESSRPNSPQLAGYNKNRETSSTTSSGPFGTRMSTAATSVSSQRSPSVSGSHTPISAGGSMPNHNLERTGTKGRRLYETGLDQHLHDQQHSAMNRIDSLSRQRTVGAQTPTSGGVSTTPSLQSLDRWDRQPISKGSMPDLRDTSPPPSAANINGFDFGVKPTHLRVETKSPHGFTAPPLSPPMTDSDENMLKVEPNDRGKATAMGAFNKPAQPYDEAKYSQRQIQMQHGRDTPPPRRHSPPDAFLPQQQQNARARADSSATLASSRSNSSSQRHFGPRDRFAEAQTPQHQATVPENDIVAPKTFQNSPNQSSVGSPIDSEPFSRQGSVNRPLGALPPRGMPNLMYRNQVPSAMQRPLDSQHPLMRQLDPQPSVSQQLQKPPTFPPPRIPPPNVRIDTSLPAKSEPKSEPKSDLPLDSPTLGPATGLSGLIHQHLRSDSNSSSIYGNEASSFGSMFPTDPLPSSTTSNPVNVNDINDWDQEAFGPNKKGFESVGSPLVNVDSAVPGPVEEQRRKPSWEIEMEKRELRRGSTDTQREQREFKNELASRRRQVQENLRHMAELETRSSSPVAGIESRNGASTPSSNPLGLLKSKPSGSMVTKQQEQAGQSKGTRIMGMANRVIGSPAPSGRPMINENAWKQEEEEMLRDASHAVSPQMKAWRQARKDAQREREHEMAPRFQKKPAAGFNEINWSQPRPADFRQRYEQLDDALPPNMGLRQGRERRPPPPVTHTVQRNASRESRVSVATSHSGSHPASGTRDRSSSDASRSKSRNGRYKDDLAKAMAEGTGSSGYGVMEDLQSARLKVQASNMSGMSPGPSPGLSPGLKHPSPLPSPATRSRSNSKSTPAGYFDPQKTQALRNGDPVEIGLSQRPAPVAPFSVNPTPSLAASTPSVSRSATPTGQAVQQNGALLAGRKKSVTKSDISEPKFISSTSRVSTVNLPPGSSLQNGNMSAPPIPSVNPRRRQTRTMFSAFMGKKDDMSETPTLPAATQSTEEMSTFSTDEEDRKPRSRQMLRKSSSDGGNLGVKALEARQARSNAASAAMPNFPPESNSIGVGNGDVRGGMF